MLVTEGVVQSLGNRICQGAKDQHQEIDHRGEQVGITKLVRSGEDSRRENLRVRSEATSSMLLIIALCRIREEPIVTQFDTTAVVSL
jgi:hypothetical protein